MAWFDIGVNLTNPRLPAETVIPESVTAGVSQLMITGTNLAESEKAIALVRQYPAHLCATAGFHPHDSGNASDADMARIAELVTLPEVAAVGECGLDFNRNFSPKDVQLRRFEQQLEIAVACGKPVFLHERDAFDEQLALLTQYRPKLKGGVAHCFTGDMTQMQAYLELDLYIGITGWLCDDKRGSVLRDAVTQLPLNRVMLESDAPYLLPKTLKKSARPMGSTNHPAVLPHIAEHLAPLMGIDIVTLQQACWDNSQQLFGNINATTRN